MDITITPQVTPTFTQIGPLCQNSTAPLLPVTSNNGYYRNMETCYYQYCYCRYHYLYIYTNCDPVCNYSYNGITITPQVTPTFTQIGPLCQNSTAPLLPATSTMDITGYLDHLQLLILLQLEPRLIHLHQLIRQCATTATMDITITPQVTPTFTQIGPLCQNSTAPLLPAYI